VKTIQLTSSALTTLFAGLVTKRDRLHERARGLRVSVTTRITKSAAELVTSGTIAEVIPRILQRLSEALHADRVLVRQNHSIGPPLTLRNAWQGPGAPVEVCPEYFASLPASQPPEVTEWQEPLQEGKPIEALRRDTRGTARVVLDIFRIESKPQAPILIDGKLFGQLSIEDFHAERSWSPVEMAAATVPADLTGAAITHESHLEKLSNANAAVRRSPAIFYRYSTAFPPRLVYVSDNLAAPGSTAAELVADPELYLKRVHPGDRGLAEASFLAARGRAGAPSNFASSTHQGEIAVG
jgi:GAF domain-containing protein